MSNLSEKEKLFRTIRYILIILFVLFILFFLLGLVGVYLINHQSSSIIGG